MHPYHWFFSPTWLCLLSISTYFVYKSPSFLLLFSSSKQVLTMMKSLVVFKAIKRKLARRRLNFSPQVNDTSNTDIPADVKEGHFVVRTFDNGEVKRFILKLGYLAHSGFLKLLDQAEEEFGFQQEGVLAVPCGPGELQRILESMKRRRS